MKRLKLFIPLIIFSLMALLFLFSFGSTSKKRPSLLVGKALPEFSLPSLGVEGEVLTHENLSNGEPYLLNVWASWCVACRIEHPYFVKLANQGIRIVGLNYKDEEDKALKWLEDFGNPYDRIIADKAGRLGLDLGITGAPETYLIGKDNSILYHHVGVVDEKVWTTKLKPMFDDNQNN